MSEEKDDLTAQGVEMIGMNEVESDGASHGDDKLVAESWDEAEVEQESEREEREALASSSERGREPVIELWTLEGRELMKCHDPESGTVFTSPASEWWKVALENDRRAKAEKPMRQIETRRFNTLRWHCKWLLTTGEELKEYDSPWPHGLHPFAVKFFPLTDGETHSFVEDVTEQQKCVNRMVTLIDKILSVSAKGALLFPIDRKPNDVSWNQIAENWSRPGGIIPFKGSDRSDEPRQISGGGDQSGATSLLDIQMRMIEQVSGVTSALQGRDTTANTSAALYDAKTKNATTALVDVLESFETFIVARNRLIANS